jgi:hypothetical protein
LTKFVTLPLIVTGELFLTGELVRTSNVERNLLLHALDNQTQNSWIQGIPAGFNGDVRMARPEYSVEIQQLIMRRDVANPLPTMSEYKLSRKMLIPMENDIRVLPISESLRCLTLPRMKLSEAINKHQHVHYPLVMRITNWDEVSCNQLLNY